VWSQPERRITKEAKPMIHTCTICGRKKDCSEDCDEPERMPMNCGIAEGAPIHQEEYLKAIGTKK